MFYQKWKYQPADLTELEIVLDYDQTVMEWLTQEKIIKLCNLRYSMSKYVAVFVWPMPKRNVAAYRSMVRKFGPIFRKLGVIEYKEYVASDLKAKHGMVPFSRRIKKRSRETLDRKSVV